MSQRQFTAIDVNTLYQRHFRHPLLDRGTRLEKLAGKTSKGLQKRCQGVGKAPRQRGRERWGMAKMDAKGRVLAGMAEKKKRKKNKVLVESERYDISRVHCRKKTEKDRVIPGKVSRA